MLVALDHLVAPLRNIAFIEVLHLAKIFDDLESVETELTAIATHVNARSFKFIRKVIHRVVFALLQGT